MTQFTCRNEVATQKGRRLKIEKLYQKLKVMIRKLKEYQEFKVFPTTAHRLLFYKQRTPGQTPRETKFNLFPIQLSTCFSLFSLFVYLCISLCLYNSLRNFLLNKTVTSQVIKQTNLAFILIKNQHLNQNTSLANTGYRKSFK